MKHFFILGRNPILSKAEIFSYLETSNIEFSEVFFKENFLILECEAKFNIQDFGGVLKLGKINFTGSEKEFEKFLEKNDLADKNKFTYAIIGNVEEDIFKEKFKKQKQKALIKRGGKSIKLQTHDFAKIANAEFEFFIYNLNNQIYFGSVSDDYSYSEVKKRDMKKPVRRESLAISPRLAKILINLSQVKKGQLLLDPFCGVGGILIEALIREINVYGSDKDHRAIEQCKDNLRWLEKNYKIKATHQLFNKNAVNIRRIQADGIATEPALGELQKSKARDETARRIIRSFENLIIPVLKNLIKTTKQNSKIVITAPYIRDFSVNWERIYRATGLIIHQIKNLELQIKEVRPDQFVGREVVVLI